MKNIVSRLFQCIWVALFTLIPSLLMAQEKDSFIISSPETTAQIILDEKEDSLVHKAVELFVDDVFNITGQRMAIMSIGESKYQLKIGTIGINADFDKECKKAGIETDTLRAKWETYTIKSVVDPKGKINDLFIAGSDSRGTAYGLMELSRMIGVSPWVWWADVEPEKKESIELPSNLFIEDGPKVKFRGIFLNDEDWGLQPWAAKTFEPETGDIGPKTYEKIFQLLLRLKANAIWPAMHPSTKAFYTIPGNQEMAAKYQIFVGTSHAEPMLRNNVDEWDHDKFGEYNYATNKDVVKKYWQDRIEALNPKDKYIVTLGMRGIHDSGMQGGFTADEKVDMLETIISDQRKMLENVLNKDVMNIPQTFVPYKEVLEIYNHGAKIPDDVTLVWPDDNHGYIRKLSNAEERKRSGGAGVYYHISYWGRPHDYLWLESAPVSLIWEEMNKAYQTNAKDIWIVNVGDIKPIEIGMNFFLEMAWNPGQFSPESLTSYYTRFAEEQFGERYSKEIGEILNTYFQLGFSRKPEHMGWNGVYPNTPIQDPMLSLFTNGDEVQQHIDAYSKLEEEVKSLQVKLPEHLQDAFYQLVAYKVLGASNMNKKILYAYKSRVYAQQQRVSTNQYAEKAKEAYEEIKNLTDKYNQQHDGKWLHMMTYNPRELSVFGMPEVGQYEPTQKATGGVIVEGSSEPVESGKEASLPTFLSATNRQYFIDIFNSGIEPLNWTAIARDPWIKISSTYGETSSDERIWVSIDWSKLKDGSRQKSSIGFKVGNSVYDVQVMAKQLSISGDNYFFVEDNGVVSIEAEHFSRAQNTENSDWRIIQGLGRQNDAVGSFPVTASPLNAGEVKTPSLSYEFFTQSSGDAILRFYSLPSQPINENYKLRFAVSIDDSQPIVVDASLKEAMNEHNEEWKTNVLRATNITELKVAIPQTGKHNLKIMMIDPAVVLDKIELVMGANREENSYFGARETIHR